MANRVTPAEVQAIMEHYPADLTPFIADANLMVTEDLADSSMSDDRLAKIEKYLSAHFASIYDPLTTQEGVAGAGSIQERFQRGQVGKGLESTQYGQQAIFWDSTGTLKRLSNGVSGTVSVDNVAEDWQV